MEHQQPIWLRLARKVLRNTGRPGRALRDLGHAAVFDKHFDRRFDFVGRLKTTKKGVDPFGTGLISKHLASVYFQYREKSEVALAAASSWYGGDYMEFGAHGMNTFRNMLSAFDLFDLQTRFPDTRFYAFDVFGKLQSDNAEIDSAMREFDRVSEGYFAKQFPRGDEFAAHVKALREHELFVDQCQLVQGYFQDTLTKDFANSYKAEGRQIGFAFIDCNIESQYKVVFEFIFGLMAEHSYVYLDELPQSPGVVHYFDEFSAALKRERSMGVVHVRNAGGFGTLFRLYPLHSYPPLELSK